MAESLRAGGASQEQISEEMADMISPPEQETLNDLTRRLDKISQAQSQVCDNIFLLRLVLDMNSKS